MLRPVSEHESIVRNKVSANGQVAWMVAGNFGNCFVGSRESKWQFAHPSTLRRTDESGEKRKPASPVGGEENRNEGGRNIADDPRRRVRKYGRRCTGNHFSETARARSVRKRRMTRAVPDRTMTRPVCSLADTDRPAAADNAKRKWSASSRRGGLIKNRAGGLVRRTETFLDAFP